MPSLDRKPLVVAFENDAASARGLGLLLSGEGYETAIGEALEHLLDAGHALERTAAIIADIDLGRGRRGDQEARSLQVITGRPLPVLLVSGTLYPQAGMLAPETGISFLMKPVDPDAIIDWLRRSID